MKLLVVMQARMGSSRLPGKVMLPVTGEPLLAAMLRRVRAAQTPFDVCIATTMSSDDDPIVELCAEHDVICYRGHPTDLIARHLLAAQGSGAEAVVKIPSDCPLIDPGVIDRVLQYYLENSTRVDYVSNLHPPTYPDGNDVEVMSFGALHAAFREAQEPFEREHTTPYIWERPDRFRIGNVTWETGLNYAMSHRFTLDYVEDYRFIKLVFEQLGGTRQVFSLSDILQLLAKKPELARINSQFVGVNWYRHHLHELRQVGPADTRMMENA